MSKETLVLNLTNAPISIWSDWERYRCNLLNDVVDHAYDKMPKPEVDAAMIKLADHITKFTGVETQWFNMADCSSWNDHGNSWFIMTKKKPWWKIAWHRMVRLWQS